MYFLWKKTPHGTIRVSCEGIADFVRRFLTAKSRLHSLVLSGGESAAVTLLLSSRDESHEPRMENRIHSLMEPMGMTPSVVWFDRGTPGSDWQENRLTLCKNPWAWMILTSAAALVHLAGWSGLFWTSFWGSVAWYAVKGLTWLCRGKKAFVIAKAPEDKKIPCECERNVNGDNLV